MTRGALELFQREMMCEPRADPGPGAGWLYPNNPRQHQRKEEWPYSYSPFFLWRDPAWTRSAAVYHDRMQQWDIKAWDRAWAAMPTKKRFEEWRTAACSKFLTEYFGKPCKATALVEGCNASSGYPYFVFYYQETRAP